MARTITITTPFKMGQLVYLMTDPCQYQRMITYISTHLGGAVTYGLTVGTDETTEHYEQEIMTEVNVLLNLNKEED